MFVHPIRNQMKVKDLNNLRKRYLERRQELAESIKKSDYEVDVAGDEVDKLQGANILRVQNQLSKINFEKLKTIDRAIDRIDNGNYGSCEECGEVIGLKRLEAMPGVTLCINCAEAIELNR